MGAGSTEKVFSCGRSDDANDAEGRLYVTLISSGSLTNRANSPVFSGIYDGDNKVCTVYWSCSWGSKANDFQI